MPKTIGFWCKQLKTEHERRGKTNWDSDYWKVLRKLPQGEQLTKAHCLELIDSSLPNTKTRVRVCMALGALCRISGHGFDPVPYKGNYSAKKAKKREIPTDEQIWDYWQKLQNPGWRWFLGMLATYGLRPHEAFFARVDADGLCYVSEGKTDDRDVWPFHPEWVEVFGLKCQQLPRVTLVGRTHTQIGHSATRHFWEIGAPFTLYSCRHAYALRLLEYGVEHADAARWMGHSVLVHTELYQKWINKRRDRAAYERVIARSDRPNPPGSK